MNSVAIDKVAKVNVTFKLNGQARSFDVYPMARLLDVLREEAGLTGTKEGCGEGECGACAILMNDELVNSCLVPVLQANGTDILTVEGLAQGDVLSEVQRAFIDGGAIQCGMCSPGMIMAVVYLLRNKPKPNEADVRVALAGNLCRCTGYMKIFESVEAACRKAGVIS